VGQPLSEAVDGAVPREAHGTARPLGSRRNIAEDCRTFKVMVGGYGEWSGEPARQKIQKRS